VAQTVLAHPFYQDVEGVGRKRMAVELALRALNFGLLVECDVLLGIINGTAFK
jgi:hypothetical protein